MKFHKIVCFGYSGKELDKAYWDKIDELAYTQVHVRADHASLSNKLSDADCLLVKLGAKIDKDIIDQAPKPKYIGMFGTGVGGIDLVYASKKKIVVCNIADYATEGVVEFAFGAILNHLREFERAKAQAQKGDYSETTFTGTEIKGKNLGVIGLGHIGGRTAEIAQAFGANVSYWSKTMKKQSEKKGISYLPINTLLKHSDIVTINLSLNPETNNFLNEQRIQMIRKGALVVNPSPMELVDLNALVTRLKKGEISFILDHSDEMTKDQLAKLRPFKNCIIYPPIAYTTEEATKLKKEIFVNNLENFLRGSTSNKVN